jgi:hypothetical protein
MENFVKRIYFSLLNRKDLYRISRAVNYGALKHNGKQIPKESFDSMRSTGVRG